jgi:membrane protein insertase Oxa1/YidC/SpoIIIJ
MLRLVKRGVSKLPDFVPFDGVRLTQMPKWLEFYAPVVEGTQHLVEAIQHTTQCPWWLSIGLLTIVLRSSMVPLVMMQIRGMSPLAKVTSSL